MVAARANRGAIRSTSRSAAHAMERGPSRGRGTRSRRRQRPENLQASIRRLERVVQALQIRYIILCGYTDNPLIPPDLFLVPTGSRPSDSAHTGGGHRDHDPGNDPLHPDTLPRPTAASASPRHPAASSSASLPPSGRTTPHHYHHHHPLVSSSTAAGSGPHAPVRPVSTAATTAALAQVTLYSPGTYHHSPETVRSFLELQQERHRLAWYYLRTRCEADCAEFLLRRNSV
ncbi:hypothetical protein IWQ60_009746 [Tieghemiomyces parasiticus]|uniref:Uncharacterized protein n=1 Tax=Tieghemiomyces parasiticus TaxID=78921 RepID=A0A9W7ZSA8_9FUNG|nr:hypothetical protein IWQ60_009746 [Tieghemiomyces parasiticus]